MKIAYVVYPDFTALDLIGPYEVISRWPAAEIHFLASAPGPVRTDCGLTVLATDTPESLPDPDLIVVPGSGNPLPVLEDEALLDWLREAAPGCQWTVSVCTGAGLYAAAGLLEGKKTTTHWGFRDAIRAFGIEVSPERVVWQDNHISGAGVSAGIDVALTLTERVHGRKFAEALQLVIEYDPEPPFDSGSPAKATRSTRRRADQMLLAGESRIRTMARAGRTIIRARRGRARRLRRATEASKASGTEDSASALSPGRLSCFCRAGSSSRSSGGAVALLAAPERVATRTALRPRLRRISYGASYVRSASRSSEAGRLCGAGDSECLTFDT